MTIFSWNASWETGNALIDEQHRELLSRFEALSSALLNGTSKEEFQQLCGFLADYAETHFAAEESLMARLGYPRLASHKAIHDDMRQRIGGLVSKYDPLPGKGSLEVMKFLTDWLLGHMDSEDRLLAKFCAEQLE